MAERYVGQIQKMAEKNLKTRCEVVLIIEQKETRVKKSEGGDLFSIDVVKMADEAYTRAVEKAGLTAGLTFENFAVSSSKYMAICLAKTRALILLAPLISPGFI